MRRFVDRWSLDLSGLTVLTEAASGCYVMTPVLAAMAGAKGVVAITSDSLHATALEVVDQTRALEKLCDLPQSVEISTDRNLELFACADIITNLGHVRPIDAEAISVLKTTAVVSLMYHGWEHRERDVDAVACREQGILLMGTNEEAPGLDVFKYCGTLCLAMLFESGLEVRGNRIVIIGGDRFGSVLEQALQAAGAEVLLTEPGRLPVAPDTITGADAIVIANYAYPGPVIGKGGVIGVEEVAEHSADTTVIQFVGGADVNELANHGIRVFPRHTVPSQRMGKTFAALGPTPVVDLLGAGLKVGEAMARARSGGLSLSDAAAEAMSTAPAEAVALSSANPATASSA